jgi:hypothetical protein
VCTTHQTSSAAQRLISLIFCPVDDGPEYSRAPDISTTGAGSSPPGYPPAIAPSGYPAHTAPVSAKYVSGSLYPPVPAAPVGYAGQAAPSQYGAPPSYPVYSAPGAPTDANSSNGYASKPDTVLHMGADKPGSPSYARPTENRSDAPYSSTYGPGGANVPVVPGVPNRPCTLLTIEPLQYRGLLVASAIGRVHDRSFSKNLPLGARNSYLLHPDAQMFKFRGFVDSIEV